MSTYAAANPSNMSLVSRVLAAVLGGYFLAALASLASLFLPLDMNVAVVLGLFLGFVVYAASILWVFLAKSARQAWLGLGAVGCIFLPVLSATPY